ncbi:MAG: hypothetical protein F6J86_05050 [Symploca sp. SIO1B1]|nr:hypothetical protein [Symploca sp. SIO1C2]NER93197.1 hypothetical protein [Symploca sp. SIO1B1]
MVLSNLENYLDVGDFYTPEAAMERQQHFRLRDDMINQQPVEEVRSEVRHQAIKLVEKLPESMLGEAIKALESLAVKAHNFK